MGAARRKRIRLGRWHHILGPMELPERLRAAWPALISVAVVLGTLGLARQAWVRADSNEAFRVDGGSVSVLERPAWLGKRGAEELALALAAASDRSPSLLDDESLEGWAERLTRHTPWVAKLLDVSPRHPGQADVRVRLHRPVMALTDGALVAADGTLLGPAPIQLTPEPLVLQDGGGPHALRDAAAATVDIGPFRESLDAEEIVVERVVVEGSGRVVFITSEGVALEWGRSGRNADLAAVDLPPSQRVANLLEVAGRRPGLFGVERVVLWKERPDIILRP